MNKVCMYIKPDCYDNIVIHTCVLHSPPPFVLFQINRSNVDRIIEFDQVMIENGCQLSSVQWAGVQVQVSNLYHPLVSIYLKRRFYKPLFPYIRPCLVIISLNSTNSGILLISPHILVFQQFFILKIFSNALFNSKLCNVHQWLLVIVWNIWKSQVYSRVFYFSCSVNCFKKHRDHCVPTVPEPTAGTYIHFC